MLELIRKYASSMVIKVFLGVLAFTFVFCFGISDIIRRYTGKDYLVKIGNVKISLPLFNLEKAKKHSLLRNRGESIDEKTEVYKILHQVIWENIIDLAATDFGFIVSDETIKRYIAGMSIFRDDNGRFKPEALRAFLYKIKVPEPMFLEFSRKDIKNSLIKAPFKYISVYNELDYYVKLNLEKRTLSIVELKPSEMSISNNCSLKELKDFYAENSELFFLPETRSFKVLELVEKNIEKNINISDDEVRDYYETSSERESRTFEEMEAEIREEIKQNKLQSEIDDTVRLIEDALTGGETVEDIANRFNLKIITAQDVTINNTCKTMKDVLKLKYAQDVLTVAFSIDEGADSSFSEAMDTNGNRLLWLVHVDSIIPKHLAEFSIVSGEVRREFLKKKKHEKALELAKSFVQQVEKGENLSVVASKNGFSTNVTSAFDRYGKIDEKRETSKYSNIISKLCESVFKLPNDKAYYVEINDNVVVYKVNKIIPANSIDQKEREKLRVRLIKETVDDLYQQLVGYLSKQKYEVKINYEMIEKTEGIDLSGSDMIF